MVPVLIAALTACQGGGEKAEGEATDSAAVSTEVVDAAPAMAYFGSEINDEGAVAASDAPGQLGEADSVNLKVTGTIEKVCQVKGCWMTMGYGEGENMHVSFRDYGFFVPKDIDGKEAVIEGTLYMETTSVEDLRHYAEDEGKSEEEIAEITEPETRLSFVADGVIVKDYDVAVNAAAEEEMNDMDDH